MTTPIFMESPKPVVEPNPAIVIPPLTCRTADGTLYVRFEAVEAEIRAMLPLPRAEWLKAKKRLKSETLVFLFRYIRRIDDYVSGYLQLEISGRTFRMAWRWIRGIYHAGTDFIATEVECEIAILLLAEVPTRQSEYLEVAFGQAVNRRTLDAIKRFNNTPSAHLGTVLSHARDEDGRNREIERPLEFLADSRPGQDEILAESESERLWDEWIKRGLKFIAEPRHREAVVLRYIDGWPVTDKDPDKPSLARHFKVSARQIQNWFKTALTQMQKGTGERYDNPKSEF